MSVLSGDCVSGDVRTTIKNGDHAEGGKNMGESIFHWENGMSWDKIHSKINEGICQSHLDLSEVVFVVHPHSD